MQVGHSVVYDAQHFIPSSLNPSYLNKTPLCVSKNSTLLTQQVRAEVVPSQVVEHGREDGQQHHVHVVEAGRAAGDGALHVAEATQLQVVQGLVQVVRCVREEGKQGRAHNLRAVAYHRSAKARKYPNTNKPSFVPRIEQIV